MNFTELGKYLDKLKLDDKLDQVFKILEDIAFPAIKVEPEVQNSINWLEATPKKSYPCFRLEKTNIMAVKTWMLSAGFDYLKETEDGLDTEHGFIKWDEWIVCEENDAIAFYSQNEFTREFIYNW